MTRRRLLLLGCGPEQLAAVRVARELGYLVIGFDNNAQAVGRSIVDEFCQVDIKSPADLAAASAQARPDGVFVHAAELAVEAATVAEQLALPGISVETARDATDKARRIERLSAAGVKTPRFRVIPADLPAPAWIEAAEDLGWPCVLKPTNQAGARGVRRIDSPADVEEYHQQRAELGCAAFVCEELLEGLELSTESIAQAGTIAHHALALRHYDRTQRLLPYFIEDGHSFPYELAADVRSEVEETIASCFRALGLEAGVLKGDLLVTASGDVYVLEMAARTSGGRFADTVVPLGCGVNILYPLIASAMGDPWAPEWTTRRNLGGVSQRFFLHDTPGPVDRWPCFSALVQRPGVHDWVLNDDLLKSQALPRLRSHRDRLGYVIVTASTREEADASALEIVQAAGLWKETP